MAEPRRPKSVWYLISELGGLAVAMPAAALVGYGIGWGLDRWLGTGKVLQIVFLFLGLVAGFVEMIRVVNRVGKD